MSRKYPTQLRFDTVPIQDVELNLECRDSIVPVLKALQHVYSNRELTTRIPDLIAADINHGTRTDTGREGLDDWHICVLAAVRPGCNLTYDQLQDLAENHRTLRAIMGLGECDENSFHHKTLRNNFCLLQAETPDQINLAIVQAGHACDDDVFGANTLQAFIVRTERVADTARRRVLAGETVPHADKLFSGFEPHTQLYKRGKAGRRCSSVVRFWWSRTPRAAWCAVR
jgi:hypothetical protein